MNKAKKKKKANKTMTKTEMMAAERMVGTKL